MGGAAAPPTPGLIFRMFAEITAPFAESSLLRSSPPFVKSSLLRASWGGLPPPPQPSPPICRMLTELSAPLVESSLPRTSPPFVESSLLRASGGGAAAPPNPPPPRFVECLQSLAHPLLNLHFLEHHAAPASNSAPYCESAAPATKLVPLAKVLHLRTAESVPDLAKVLRLLRNLYLTFLTHPAEL